MRDRVANYQVAQPLVTWHLKSFGHRYTEFPQEVSLAYVVQHLKRAESFRHARQASFEAALHIFGLCGICGIYLVCLSRGLFDREIMMWLERQATDITTPRHDLPPHKRFSSSNDRQTIECNGNPLQAITIIK